MSSRRRIVVNETNEIAKETASTAQAGGLITGIVSVLALLFSGVSLYHSVLKQPELKVLIPSVVHYTRDPYGDQEVFAVPITIANHGARDGAVVNLRLRVGSDEAGISKTFESAYAVDQDFFVGPQSFNMQTKRFDRVDRPKAPFAPISIAGRSNYTGTLLFYRSEGKAFPKLVTRGGKLTMTLEMETANDTSLGAVDRFLAEPVQPITFSVAARNVDPNRLKRGATHRMRRVKTAASEPGAQ